MCASTSRAMCSAINLSNSHLRSCGWPEAWEALSDPSLPADGMSTWVQWSDPSLPADGMSILVQCSDPLLPADGMSIWVQCHHWARWVAKMMKGRIWVFLILQKRLIRCIESYVGDNVITVEHHAHVARRRGKYWDGFWTESPQGKRFALWTIKNLNEVIRATIEVFYPVDEMASFKLLSLALFSRSDFPDGCRKGQEKLLIPPPTVWKSVWLYWCG